MTWMQTIAGFLLAAVAFGAAAAETDTYDRKTVIAEAEAFFGEGAAGLGELMEKLFAQYGRPSGYIKGEEAGGAIGVGVRYGNGTLTLKNGAQRGVHWTGPSIGFDFGAAASKVFVLVYRLHDSDRIFQRFPGVEGSLYFIAGVGANYLEGDGIGLAPVRAGVGWRQGASVGYMHFTREKRWNPL
jgi:hypothetical protein